MTPESTSYLLGNPALVEDLRARLIRLRALPTPALDPYHGPYVSVVAEESGKAITVTGSEREIFALCVPETMCQSNEEDDRAVVLVIAECGGSLVTHKLPGITATPMLNVYEANLGYEVDNVTDIVLRFLRDVFQISEESSILLVSFDGSESPE